jgi:hypothetical protein
MAHAVLFFGSLGSRRIECSSSMHDRGEVASGGYAVIFRWAEGPGSAIGEQGLSNAAAGKHASWVRFE